MQANVKPPVAAKSRAQGIDVVRALAALAVLTYHVWLYAPANVRGVRRDQPLDYFFFELRIGLVMFFVLSGYLLYRPLLRATRSEARDERSTIAATANAARVRWPWAAELRPIALMPYYLRRIVRIFPSYYLALVGSVLLLWYLGDTPGVRLPAASDLWVFLVFGQNYFDDTLLKLDAPTWTLAVQVAFYAVFPLMVWLARRLGERAWLATLGWVALGIAFNAWAWHQGLGAVARLSLLAMLPYMALGMLAAHLPARSRRAAWTMIWVGVGVAGADLVWHAFAGADAAASVLRDVPAAIGFMLICGGVGYAEVGYSPRLRPVEAFGRWSYGVFLWHLPLLLFLQGEGLAPANGVARWALLVLLSAAVGALNWRFVERPLLARSRGAGKLPPKSPGAKPTPRPAA